MNHQADQSARGSNNSSHNVQLHSSKSSDGSRDRQIASIAAHSNNNGSIRKSQQPSVGLLAKSPGPSSLPVQVSFDNILNSKLGDSSLQQSFYTPKLAQLQVATTPKVARLTGADRYNKISYTYIILL